MSEPAPVFLLVDGHSLAYRAFYAYARGAEGGLRTSTGVPTSVSYGFIKILLDVLEREQPVYAAVAFDTRMPTFRHEVDDTYKAGRAETPDEFVEDLQNLRTILDGLTLPQFELPGYEADDLIGTFARQGAAEGCRVKILSGDQDLFQLITIKEQDAGTITVLHQNSRTGLEEFGPEQVKAKLGVAPEQVVDYKALCGDASDNIPGVKGIGAKTAVKLLEEYGTLENLLHQVGSIPGATGKKLQADEEAARHSYWMATIQTDVPLVADLEACRLHGFEADVLVPLFEQLEFKSFLRQLERLQRLFGGVTLPPQPKPQAPSSDNYIPARASEDDLWFDFGEVRVFEPVVEVVQTAEQWEAFLALLAAHGGPVAWDTETTSLDPIAAHLVGIGCSWDGETAYYLPLRHTTGENLIEEQVIAGLKPYWEDAERPKVFQNAKYDRLVLRSAGVELAGVVFDPMLASYVLNPEDGHSLQALAQNHLQIAMGSYTALVGKGRTIDQLGINEVARYCAMDVVCTYQLLPVLTAQLEEIPRLDELLKAIELPLEPVLADMEWQGIRIDRDYLKELSTELDRDLQAIEQESYQIAGENFNLNSPKQLSDVLFGKLGLSSKKSRKTSLGYSTDAAVLEKLRDDHPLVETLLNYRTLSKLKSTYVDALPQLVNPKTDRVHTDFNQTVTTTGRLSSSNPNLQNIPVRTSFSRRIRRGFVPEPGWLLVAADYSQIELRILAHLTREDVLLKAFQTDDDVHTLTAKLLLGKSEVSADERRLAKTLNYGIVYGMGARRFAREAGVGQAVAESFISAYKQRYPNIFTYFDQTRRLVLEQGYVETILGRRRYFHDLERQGQREREAMLRAAVNAPIQGTASDIIKLAMARLHDKLRKYTSRLLLQVHDELVLEVPPQEWDEVLPLIRTEMENAFTLCVPLKVEINSGKNWMEAK